MKYNKAAAEQLNRLHTVITTHYLEYKCDSFRFSVTALLKEYPDHFTASDIAMLQNIVSIHDRIRKRQPIERIDLNVIKRFLNKMERRLAQHLL